MEQKLKENESKTIYSKNNNKRIEAGIGPVCNKGITLVALIITIIILLILAVVTINAISGNGIIAHAKNAKTQYLGAQVNEQRKINELSNFIDNNVNEKPKDDSPTTTFSFTLGTNTYQYDEGMTWRQWINSDYNTIGMAVSVKPNQFGISHGYCISYTGNDSLENACLDEVIKEIAGKEVVTIKGDHYEGENHYFDVLTMVNKRSNFWVEVTNITGQINAVRPDDVINVPGGGYCNFDGKETTLSVGDELQQVKNVKPQYCSIDAWDD